MRLPFGKWMALGRDTFPRSKLYLRTLKQLREGVVHLLLLVLSLFFALEHLHRNLGLPIVFVSPACTYGKGWERLI